MAYTFEPILVADPKTFTRAVSAACTVYDVKDNGNTTPLALTDLSGVALPNPITASGDAFLPPFKTTSAHIKIVGGGLSVTALSADAILSLMGISTNPWPTGVIGGEWENMVAGPVSASGTLDPTALAMWQYVMPETRSYSQIGLNVTAAAAGASFQLTFYTYADGTLTQLFAPVTIDAATTGLKTVAQTFTLPAGPLLVALKASASTIQYTAMVHGPALVGPIPTGATATSGDGSVTSLRYTNATFPASFAWAAASFNGGLPYRFPLLKLKR